MSAPELTPAQRSILAQLPARFAFTTIVRELAALGLARQGERDDWHPTPAGLAVLRGDK
jgi:hypothetical protein